MEILINKITTGPIEKQVLSLRLTNTMLENLDSQIFSRHSRNQSQKEGRELYYIWDGKEKAEL